MANIRSPFIIIGAGRSGSSLLRATLEAHPQIAMHGEMNCAAAKLWDIFWNTSAAAEARSARAHAGTGHDERGATAAVARTALDQLYNVSASPQARWGFKDIWIKQDCRVDWRIYDDLFPEAVYLHLVRHPFTFARSSADWNRTPFTLGELRGQLIGWVDYLTTNRARQDTGRYVLLTYEDLARDPRATLAPLLERFGLPWDDACLSACARQHVPSVRRSRYPAGSYALLERLPELIAWMEQLGYEVPELDRTAADAGEPRPQATTLVTRVDARTYRLDPPFVPDGTYGWGVPLALVPALAGWGDRADSVEDPTQSPLRLFEDGRPLGPPHALHTTVRDSGEGAYSHWVGNALLFATSDNSDPNTNGRTYTITFDATAPAA